MDFPNKEDSYTVASYDPNTNKVVYKTENIPVPRQGLSLQQQAAYATAVAHLNNEEKTPASTPIIGSVPISVAIESLKGVGINMDSPQAVIARYGATGTDSSIDPATGELKFTVDTDDAKDAVDPEDPDYVEMSITGLLDTIKDTPQIPLAIVGDAGTGKTSIIRQWAKDNGYELNLFLANTASEDDVAGAITPDHEKHMAVTYPLEKLHRSTTHKTVLFLDELNTARREVQDPLLTLIQDRTLPNGTPLHKETIIVTAINPSATYNNHEMSPQLRNRFMWYYHKPTEYEWVTWMGTTELGKTDAGKHIEEMVLSGTIKFDKDETFTDERNEFTTPRSLYNLLQVSKGSVSRLKSLAESLVSGPTAEAIRLHGYTDKDTRGNTFFNERKKEAVDEFGSLPFDMTEIAKQLGLNTNNGLDNTILMDLWKKLKQQGYQRPVYADFAKAKLENDMLKAKNYVNSSPTTVTLSAEQANANDPLGLTGPGTNSADELAITNQISERLKGF